MNIGILGCGTIGTAVASGIRGRTGIENVFATTRHGARSSALDGVTFLEHNTELAQRSDVIVLCVKPFQAQEALREIAPHLRPSQTLVSIAAGVRCADLETWSGGTCIVVRAMTNTPARIGEGMTVIAGLTSEHEDRLAIVEALFEPLGRVAVVDEALMDAVTALSGCGPAYVYMIVEALSEAGVKLGLPRKTALLLAAQTLHGASKLLLTSGSHPAALKDEITTPAGCTIDGLMALEEGGLRSTLMNGVIAAARRSASLS